MLIASLTQYKKAFLSTIERRGRCEKEQPKVGPKGERVGMNESNYPDRYGRKIETMLAFGTL
jgi:hypothetical protein